MRKTRNLFAEFTCLHFSSSSLPDRPQKLSAVPGLSNGKHPLMTLASLAPPEGTGLVHQGSSNFDKGDRQGAGTSWARRRSALVFAKTATTTTAATGRELRAVASAVHGEDRKPLPPPPARFLAGAGMHSWCSSQLSIGAPRRHRMQWPSSRAKLISLHLN